MLSIVYITDITSDTITNPAMAHVAYHHGMLFITAAAGRGGGDVVARILLFENRKKWFLTRRRDMQGVCGLAITISAQSCRERWPR